MRIGWPPIDTLPIIATGSDCGRLLEFMPMDDMPIWAMFTWPGAGAGAIGWGGLALLILGGFGEGGGPEPRNSPLLTNDLKGLPRHLMLDKYFLALLPDFSSNSLGVSHSSPSKMHFPLDPDSYLLT